MIAMLQGLSSCQSCNDLNNETWVARRCYTDWDGDWDAGTQMDWLAFQVALNAGDFVGDDVIVLGGMQRHGHAAHAPDAFCPLARAINHHLGGDLTRGTILGPPRDRARDAILRDDTAHARVFA